MSIEAKRAKRLLAGVLAGAVALSVTPILGLTGTAGALEPATGDGSVCEDPPAPEPFTDVTDADPSQAEIECLFNSGITVGTSATTYSPNASVQRRQMALFLVRLADALEENEVGDEITALPAGDGVTAFTDIAAENEETQDAIDRLNDAGIALGTTATTFSPGDNVTREQMAAFVVRLQEFVAGEDATPDDAPDAFTDDDDSFAEDELNILAAEGVYLGVGGGQVNPGDPITRRQMANVLIRKAQYMFENGFITRLFAEDDQGDVDFEADLEGVQLAEFDYDGDTGTRAVTATFTGLDDSVDYHVALFQHADTSEGEIETVTNENGSYVFRDKQDSENAPFDSLADYECTSVNDAEIVSINGVSVNSECDYDVNPEDGELEVRLQNDSYESDAVWLVVWQDADNDDELDLAADNTPSEAFGIVGPIIWHGGEAPTGYDGPSGEYVIYVDREANFFVTDYYYMFRYDENDEFAYDSDFTVTFADFESWLNVNDYIYNEDGDGNSFEYNRNPGAENKFSLYDEGPEDPTGLTATAGDFDDSGSDVSANDVRLDWTHDPARANMEETEDGYAGYCWYRYAAATFGTTGDVDSDCWTYSDDDDDSDAAIENTQGVVEDVPAGNWIFTVSALSADDYESDESEPAAAVTTAVATGAPKSVSTSTNDLDLNGRVTTGDVLTATFDQAMVDTGSAKVTFKDGDGTVCSVTDGVGGTTIGVSDVNATPGTETVTITVGTLDCTSAGSVGGLQYPAEVTGSSGIVDDDQGLEWNVTESPDKTFE